MKMLFSFLICSLLLNTIAGAQSWEGVAARVERSVVRVETAERVCTGFSIHQRLGHVLTCYHCISDDSETVVPFTVQQLPSYVVEVFPEWDLAVIANILPTPGLTPRHKGIKKGLPVAALGFAFTLPTLTLTQGVIGAPRAFFLFTDPFMLVSFHYISGMSGGPVFDREGRIVSIVQKADDLNGIGFGRPLVEIMELTRRYWKE